MMYNLFHIRLFPILCLFLTCLSLNAQTKQLDSLEKVLQTKLTDAQKIETQLQLYSGKKFTHLDSAYLHLSEIRQFLQTNISNTNKLQLYRAFAEYHVYKSNYDSAIHFADLGIDLNFKEEPNGLIDLYSTKGTAYYYKNDFENAIQSHLEAEKLCDPSEDNEGKARVFNNIGIAHIKLENWDKAEEYMNKSLQICEALDIKRGISYCLGNLGIIYRNQNKYDEAIEIYKTSIELNKEMDDARGLERNYNNLGNLYERLEDYQAALYNYKESYKIAEALDIPYSKALSYHNIASVQNKMNQTTEALVNYEKSLEIAKSLENNEVQMNVYKGISEVYEKKKAFQESLAYRKLYEAVKDSFINESNRKNINELEIKYETANKEKDILALSATKLKNEAAIEKQKNRIILLSFWIVGLGILFTAIIIIYRQYLSSKKQSEIIETIVDTQISERKRIAQDLHDSIGGSISLSKNKLQSIIESESIDSKEAQSLLKTLTNTGNEVRQISHNLMPGELVKFGLQSAIKSIIDQTQNLEIHFYCYGLDSRINETKELHIFRIIQELIQNTIKHADAKNLFININKKNKTISLMVEDDGKGFSVTNKSEGMGLKGIKNRVSLMKGNIEIDSKPNKGTTYNIQIPL